MNFQNDLSTNLSNIRSKILDFFPGLSDLQVLHLFVPAKIQSCNYNGIGPWARVWALPKPYHVNYPSNYVASHKQISFIIAFFVPRVFCTSDFLETLLHEYLHVGHRTSELYHHPPKEEGFFISRASDMATLFRSDIKHGNINHFLSGLGNGLKTGLCIPDFLGEDNYQFQNPINTDWLTV